MAANGPELGIDAERMAVAGSSAGGALAARLAQRAAEELAPPMVFCLLHQPVLDDRSTPSKLEFDSVPGFDAPAVALMWQHYLAGRQHRPTPCPPAPPNLPVCAATLITCSELDPLRDEAVDYARAADVGGRRDGAPALYRT